MQALKLSPHRRQTCEEMYPSSVYQFQNNIHQMLDHTLLLLVYDESRKMSRSLVHLFQTIRFFQPTILPLDPAVRAALWAYEIEAVEAVEAVAGRDAIIGVATQKERLAANWESMKRTDNVLGAVTVNRSYTTSVENKYGTLGSIKGDGFNEKSQYQAGSNGEPNG